VTFHDKFIFYGEELLGLLLVDQSLFKFPLTYENWKVYANIIRK
jgi:hypothetical protein